MCSDVSSLVLESVERLFAERTLVRTVVFPFRRNVRCCCCRRGGSRCLCRCRCHSVVLERGNCLRNRPENYELRKKRDIPVRKKQCKYSTAQHSSRGRRGRSVRAIIRRTDELLPTPRWKKKAVFPAWSEQTGQERPRGCRDLPTGAQPDRKN